MNFIRFGNHVIAPAGATAAASTNYDYDTTPLIASPPSSPTTPRQGPTTKSVPDPAEVIALAHLLQSKIKNLERGVAERKARREDWQSAVARLDKTLVALRVQEAKEGDKLAKLVKEWNKAALVGYRSDGRGPGALSNLAAPYALPTVGEALRYGFDLPRDFPPPQQGRFVCPTTVAASAFNGNDERYRDTYAFGGSWDAPSGIASPASSSGARSVHREHRDERNSFYFTMSPEAVDSGEASGSGRRAFDGGHRSVFGDIRNTTLEGGSKEWNNGGRKRKSGDWEGDAYDEEPKTKKGRAGELKRYDSGRDEGNGKRWLLGRKTSETRQRAFGGQGW